MPVPRRAAVRPQAVAGAQAPPESEFHAGAVGEAVTVEDLLGPLAEQPNFSAVRRQLQGLARKDVLPDPGSEVKRTREERAVQYEATTKYVRKWVPQMQRMRLAEQVVLDDEQDVSERAQSGTALLVSTFEPVDDFERELEAATMTAGTNEEELKKGHQLPMNPRIRDQEQTKQLARLRALIMREHQSSKRIKKIKSKTYRKIHRKGEAREREAMLERLEQENPELAKALKQEYEKKHAQMRMLRNRNARAKWAQTMQRFAKGEKTAQREISKQAQRAHDEERSLRRAIRGQDPDQSDDSAAVDLSGSDCSDDEGRGKRTAGEKALDKARKLTLGELRDLEKGGELPETGLLGMPFMREAIKKRREEAKAEAMSVLKELDGLEDRWGMIGEDESDGEKDPEEKTKAAAKAKAKADTHLFTPEELAAARAEVDLMLDRDGESLECSVSGPLTVRGVAAEAPEGLAPSKRARRRASASKAAPETGAEDAGADGDAETVGGSKSSNSRPRRSPGAAAAAAAPAENPWLAEAPAEDEAAPDAEGPSKASESSKAATPRRAAAKSDDRKRSRRKRKQDEATEQAQGASIEDVLGVLNADSQEAEEQRRLVRTAFVQGLQEEDFDKEQEEQRKEKEDKSLKASDTLAGWGSWTGSGITARRPQNAEDDAAAKADVAGSAKKRPIRVEIMEANDMNKSSAKYFIDKLPYPYESPVQYNQQMKMPTGPEWNTMSNHMNRIKPKLFMKVGAIVPPISHVKHLPPVMRKSAIETWSQPKQPKRLKARL